MGMPVKDLDLAVEGDAPSLARHLASEVGGRVVVHPSFGTASIMLGDGRVDLVTARREVYPQPAALPQVTPGNIDDDLARRDFTINAMAVPMARDVPQLLDPHGGVADIRAGVIRVLHPNSFVDDPTRVLRAVRYEQRLGFCVEDVTLRRLQEALARGHFGALSGDRLRHELERILEERRPGLALARAARLGVLAAIHPSLAQAQAVERLAGGGVDASPRRNPSMDAGQAPLAAPEVGGAGPLVYLAALVYPLAPGEAEGVIRRLNTPKPWTQVVRDTVGLKQREPQLSAPSLLDSQLVRLVEEFDEAAVLTVSRVTNSPPVAQCLSRYLKELRHLSPKLDGRDLLALGVPSGPLVGRILRELRDATLDGRVSTEEGERRLVQESLAREGRSAHG
jgi:tRNA nucleotidyltransferase (CCA-adding enzyme)